MTKKKLLFIEHAYHTKTKSSLFIQDILSSEYDISTFAVEPLTDNLDSYHQLKGLVVDVLVLWQVMPRMEVLREYIHFNKGAFFPMYDFYNGMQGLENPVWEGYSDFQIICFSKALYDELKFVGFSAHYIQYFPKPIEITNMGDEKSLFFWPRTDKINLNTVAELFKNVDLSHIHLHKAIDPNYRFVEPPEKLKEIISTSSWYEKKEEMQADMQKSALYMAPRVYEGIGMSFLEAMAMGRCVFAPHTPTMNEYIKHGKTGFLYQVKNPYLAELKEVRQIQKNTIDYMAQGYQKWEQEKGQILKWIDEAVVTNKEKLIPYLSRNKEGYSDYKLFVLGFCVFEFHQTPVHKNYKIFKIPVLRIKQKLDGSKIYYYFLNCIPFLVVRKKEF